MRAEKAQPGERPVAKDDDCVPAKPVVHKPKVVKRSVFAEGAAQQPEHKRFSEQVRAAKQRIAPPVAKPRPAPDC